MKFRMINIINFSTKKKNELVDITEKIQEIVNNSGVEEGICTIYSPHSTGAIVINENSDPQIKEDICEALKIIVKEHGWKHDKVDNNASSHIRASILGCSKTILINKSKLLLGTWQNIFFYEGDGPRSERKVIVKIIEG